MFKAVLFAFIIFGCGLVGQAVKNYYKQKVCYWSDALLLIVTLQAELDFYQSKLPDVINKISLQIGSAFLVDAKTLLKAVSGGCQQDVTINNKLLTGDQNANITRFFQMLGGTDIFSQKVQLDYYKNIFDGYKANAEEDYNKKGGMIFKLCVLAGLLLCVILL